MSNDEREELKRLRRENRYIPTAQGWLYLAVLIDLYSRRVVGWAMSSCIDQKLTLSALCMALVQRRPDKGFIPTPTEARSMRHMPIRRSFDGLVPSSP